MTLRVIFEDGGQTTHDDGHDNGDLVDVNDPAHDVPRHDLVGK